MQKWSSKHIRSTQGEKAAPQWGAGRAQGTPRGRMLGTPCWPQGRARPSPDPCSARPVASTAIPRKHQHRAPSPSCNNSGSQPRPGAAASSLHLYMFPYSRAVLPSYGSRKHGQDRIWGGPVFLPPPPHSDPAPGLWILIVRGDTVGPALAKVCPCPQREVPSRAPEIRLSEVSIMSLELAHNENKFCLIFACVLLFFFHSYRLVRKGRPYAGPLPYTSHAFLPFWSHLPQEVRSMYPLCIWRG